jgi:hypothetical protein
MRLLFYKGSNAYHIVLQEANSLPITLPISNDFFALLLISVNDFLTALYQTVLRYEPQIFWIVYNYSTIYLSSSIEILYHNFSRSRFANEPVSFRSVKRNLARWDTTKDSSSFSVPSRVRNDKSWSTEFERRPDAIWHPNSSYITALFGCNHLARPCLNWSKSHFRWIASFICIGRGIFLWYRYTYYLSKMIEYRSAPFEFMDTYIFKINFSDRWLISSYFSKKGEQV